MFARTTPATWLALCALLAQTLAFAAHGPIRVQADAAGGLVICTAEGIKRLGGEPPATAPGDATHACLACVTLAGSALAPTAGTPPAPSTLPDGTAMPIAAVAPRTASAHHPAQPRAPPTAA